MPDTPYGMFTYFEGPIELVLEPLRAFQTAVESQLRSRDAPTVLDADATAVSSNTLTPPSGFSRGVLSGKRYRLKLELWVTAASVAEGIQFDLGGGTATVGWLRAKCVGYDGSSLAFVSPDLTALTTVFAPQDAFSGLFEIVGSLQASSDGTFAPRIAQAAHASGSVQVLKGSTIMLQEALG